MPTSRTKMKLHFETWHYSYEWGQFVSVIIEGNGLATTCVKFQCEIMKSLFVYIPVSGIYIEYHSKLNYALK